jgi:hypothetical protein
VGPDRDVSSRAAPDVFVSIRKLRANAHMTVRRV